MQSPQAWATARPNICLPVDLYRVGRSGQRGGWWWEDICCLNWRRGGTILSCGPCRTEVYLRALISTRNIFHWTGARAKKALAWSRLSGHPMFCLYISWEWRGRTVRWPSSWAGVVRNRGGAWWEADVWDGSFRQHLLLNKRCLQGNHKLPHNHPYSWWWRDDCWSGIVTKPNGVVSVMTFSNQQRQLFHLTLKWNNSSKHFRSISVHWHRFKQTRLLGS